jgi:hypothetical protein
MWVDDTSQMERAMKQSFPTLKTVLEDATHGMRRYARTLPDGHVGTKAFMGNLSRAFFEVVESDKDQLKKKLMEEGRWGAPGTSIRAAAEKLVRSKCRHFIPEPRELRARVEKVVNDHATVVDPITNRALFTADTYNVHQSILALIDAGKFSDPLPVDQMFLRLNSGKQGKFIGLRGTSKLEGFHCHLAKVLQGNRCSAELAGAMMADFTHAWNIDRAITNIEGTEDYGCYDTMLLERINELCSELGLDLQFPKLKGTPKLKKIPPMFTLAVPPELVDVLCPPEGGIAPLNGAAVEGDDACLAIDEFENQAPQCLLPTKSAGATATAAPVPAPAITAAAVATVDFQPVEMHVSPALQPLESRLWQRQAEEEAQLPIFRATLQQSPLALQQEQQVGVVNASDEPTGRRSPSKRGKRRGRPPKNQNTPKKNEEEVPLHAASPLSASTFSAHVRRSPGSKRRAMPADYSRSVATEGEALLLSEVMAGDVASPQNNTAKRQRQIAKAYNLELQKQLIEDPEAAAGKTFKQAKHVKEYLQRSTETLAVAVTNQQVLANQQRGSQASVPMEAPAVPLEALQQQSSLNWGMDMGSMASQQVAMPVPQPLLLQQQQQASWWLPPLQQASLPSQHMPGQYCPVPMHPSHPISYPSQPSYGMYDPIALVQATVALLQAQQQQPPLAAGKGGGKGAPGKPRNCSKCGKPLKGKNKDEGACHCKSRGE